MGSDLSRAFVEGQLWLNSPLPYDDDSTSALEGRHCVGPNVISKIFHLGSGIWDLDWLEPIDGLRSWKYILGSEVVKLMAIVTSMVMQVNTSEVKYQAMKILGEKYLRTSWQNGSWTKKEVGFMGYVWIGEKVWKLLEKAGEALTVAGPG